MRTRIALFLSLIVLAIAPVVTAQDSVSLTLRANVQDDFIRLVFAGTGLPNADITQDGTQGLTISFARAVNVADLAAATKDISPATSLSTSGDRVIQVKTGDIARHRSLTLGNRLFVDIFTKAAPSETAAAQDEPAPAPEPAKPAEKPVETPAEKPAEKPAATPESGSLVTDDETQQATAEQAAPATPAPAEAQQKPAITQPVTEPVVTPNVVEDTKPAKPFTGSALITIGSTQGVALAAFVRSGYLWMVLSQEQLSVPPQISGPDAAALGPIDFVDIDGGSAYRVKLPAGAHVRPEGAGLVWRLYVQGSKPTLRSVSVEQDFSNTAEGPQLHIPLNAAVSALRLPDPLIGDDLAVITSGRADGRLTSSDSYVDFDLLPAIVGAVVRPKADGIRIAVLPNEVVVSRQGGLRMSAAGPRRPGKGGIVAPAEEVAGKAERKAPEFSHIFSLDEWGMGGPKQYLDMRRSIDARVAAAPEERKLPELLSGAKFMLGQGLPQEANGFMQMALGFMPTLRESAEFEAMRGAALALEGDTDNALAAFSAQGLQNNDEMDLWRAYATARAGKLADAQKMMPKATLDILATYPERVRTMLLPPLIEAVLARGDVTLASNLTDAYDRASGVALDLDRDNAVAYYRGRVAQLRGQGDAANDYYRAAAEGIEGPYPVRATLALVERGLSAKTIGRDEAIRKLERFRYGWRGDNLESDVLERLGLVYVTGGEQRRGLTILRDAATMATDPTTRDKLVAVMQKAFRELFSGKTREKMTPLESAAVAAEFAELMPSGGEGEGITMTIADQMVAVDLLDRAAGMIEPLVMRTETLANALRYAQRAAAIRILNDQPSDALRIIDKALGRPDAQAAKTLSSGDTKAFALLRAKAKAEMKKPDEALAELAPLPEDAETLRLTADIAWGSQRWDVAADAFGKLVKRANLSATRPVTKDQAQLVLNQALALNLAGETDELETLRLAYGDIMRRSELNQPFQLVTRTAQEATLADRETLLQLVSEVNMFKEVLDTYRAEPAAPTSAGQQAQSSGQEAGQQAPAQGTSPTEPGQN